ARAAGARLGAPLARAGDACEVRAVLGHEVSRDLGRGVDRALRRAPPAVGVRAGTDEALRRRTVLSTEGGGGCARARPPRATPPARGLIRPCRRAPAACRAVRCRSPQACPRTRAGRSAARSRSPWWDRRSARRRSTGPSAN